MWNSFTFAFSSLINEIIEYGWKFMSCLQRGELWQEMVVIIIIPVVTGSYTLDSILHLYAISHFWLGSLADHKELIGILVIHEVWYIFQQSVLSVAQLQ